MHNACMLSTDINENGIVNMIDVLLWAAAFGSEAEDNPNTPWNETGKWNPKADLNGDGKVNILDGIRIATDFGKTWPYI